VKYPFKYFFDDALLIMDPSSLCILANCGVSTIFTQYIHP